MVGGTLLAPGVTPRLSALALAGSLIPTTLAGHDTATTPSPAPGSAAPRPRQPLRT